MIINPKDYFRIVPPSLREGVRPGLAISRVQKYYCPAMTKIGKCTTACDDCQSCLCNIMTDVKTFKNPRNLGAIMTYVIRDVTSKIADTTEVVTVKEHKDWLGQKIEANPFELAMKEL